MCTKYNAVSHCKSGHWVRQPCTKLRRDEVKQHADSEMHKGSEQLEAIAAVTSVEGGIAHAFETTVALKRKAVLGAMKIP